MITFLKKLQKAISVCIVIFSLAIFFYSYTKAIANTKEDIQNNYNIAVEEISSGGDYRYALQLLSQLDNYRDSLRYINLANARLEFQNAEMLKKEGRYEEALEIFMKLRELSDFDESEKVEQSINEINLICEELQNKAKNYDLACQYLESQKYIDAYLLFNELEDYEKSEELAKTCDTAIKILQNSTTISAGVVFSVGITEDGKVKSSGNTILSQDDVESWTDIISISAFGSLVIGLRMDGTVITAGKLDNDYRIETGNWDDIIAVAAGDLYVVGLRENGTLVAQGYNGDGQMDIDEWRNVKAISAGWRHTVGLTEEGEILIAGIRSNDEAKIRNDENWNNIIAISAGGGYPGKKGEQGHTVGLKSNGEVVAIGDNGNDQCEVDEWEDIVAISAGAFHTVGLTRKGKVVTTQKDENIISQINKWENIVAISAGYGTTFALCEDGTVYSVGYSKQHQRDIEEWGKLAVHEDEWAYIFNGANE